MIPVRPQPQPPEFDEKVGRPGRAWLERHPRGDPPGLWRDVHHGLRFWDMVPGIQFDHPSDLYGLTLDEWIKYSVDERRPVIPDVYAPWSQLGEAASRAAEWITELIDSKYA